MPDYKPYQHRENDHTMYGGLVSGQDYEIVVVAATYEFN